jgi:hypothetical protein
MLPVISPRSASPNRSLYNYSGDKARRQKEQNNRIIAVFVLLVVFGGVTYSITGSIPGASLLGVRIVLRSGVCRK